MNKRKRRNAPQSTPTALPPDVLATFFKAKNEFTKAYKKSGRLSVLVARQIFEQKIEEGFRINKANEILNDPRKMKKFLDEFHEIYLQSEQGKIEQLLKNTSFKSAMIAGVTSGTVIMLLSPFFNPLVQPLVDKVFGIPPKKTESPAPAPAPAPAPIQAVNPSPAQKATAPNNRPSEKETPPSPKPIQRGKKWKKQLSGQHPN